MSTYLVTAFTIVFYIIAIYMLVSRWLDQREIYTSGLISTALTAICGHALLLGMLILMTQNTENNFSLFNVFSLVGLLVCILMTLTIKQTRLWLLLPIIYMFAALHTLTTALLSDQLMLSISLNTPLIIHIGIALLSYAILLIGALFSLQLAYLNHQLKHKKALSINPNLPPLMMVERQSFKIISLGTGLLVLTIVSAIFYTDNMFNRQNAHNTVFSLMALVCYAILLWGHYAQGWRGKRTIWLSLLGISLLSLGYFGSRIVREIILS